MRVAALVLGIIGGIAGLIGALVALFVGGVGGALEAEGASTVVGLGWAALFLSILGIVGAALALGKPRAAGVLMLISGFGGFIAVSMAYIVGGPLLVIAGIFALVGARKTPEESASPT